MRTRSRTNTPHQGSGQQCDEADSTGFIDCGSLPDCDGDGDGDDDGDDDDDDDDDD